MRNETITKDANETAQQDTKATKKKGLLLGMVIGSAIGAASALLVAPKSGTAVRGDISKKYRLVSDKTQEKASDVGKKTKELASKVSSQTNELVGRAKETKNNFVNSFQSSKEEVQDDLKEKVSSK